MAWKDKLKGGRADKNTPFDGVFDPEELLKGLLHELEHTKDPHIALEIAMDHCREDKHYYTHLKQKGIK